MRDDAGEGRETPYVVEAAATLPRVSAAEILRWLAPWLFGAALVAAFLLGLIMASAASNSGDRALGYATAGLALLALAWDIKASFDGRRLSLWVETAEALLVLIVLLGALAIAGLILAARAESFALQSTGYALFIVALALAFLNLKHYFDRGAGASDAPKFLPPRQGARDSDRNSISH